MKRFLSLLVVFLLISILVACGQSKKVYQLKEDGMTSTVTIKHKEDEILEQKTEDVLTYDMLGVNSKDEAKLIFSFVEAGFGSIPGVKLDVKYKRNEVIQSVQVNYKKVDLDELYEWGSIVADIDFADMRSLKETEKVLEAQGYQKK